MTMMGYKTGQYTLLNKIGEGGFSQVWRGVHRMTKMNVAVKAINKFSETYKEEDVAREIDCMKMLDHPYIVKIFEVIEEEKFIFIIMEYLENGTLQQEILRQFQLSEKMARKYLIQLLDAVKYIHEHGILHRDIKAENILLDRNYNIRLVDFGFSHRKSLAKTACGSPVYVSPEMILHEQYSEKTDIWSIGVLLFFMLTGHYPFYSKSMTKLMYLIVNSTLEFHDAISSSAQNLIRQMLAKDQNMRISIDNILSHQWITEWESLETIDMEKFHNIDIKLVSSVTKLIDVDKNTLLNKLKLNIIDDDTVAFTIISRESKTRPLFDTETNPFQSHNLPSLNIGLVVPKRCCRKSAPRILVIKNYKTYKTKKGLTTRT